MQAPETVDSWVRALRDPDENVRFRAAYLLGGFRDPKAVDALRAALDEPNPVVRREIASALFLLGGMDVKMRRAAAREALPGILPVAASALRTSQDPKVVQMVSSALSDQDPVRRCRASSSGRRKGRRRIRGVGIGAQGQGHPRPPGGHRRASRGRRPARRRAPALRIEGLGWPRRRGSRRRPWGNEGTVRPRGAGGGPAGQERVRPPGRGEQSGYDWRRQGRRPAHCRAQGPFGGGAASRCDRARRTSRRHGHRAVDGSPAGQERGGATVCRRPPLAISETAGPSNRSPRR